MKKLSKLTALLLAIFMLAAIAACGKGPAVRIIGTWKGTIDFTDIANKSFEAELGSVPTESARLTMDITLTFNEDGTLNVEYDTAAAAVSFEAYMNSIGDFIKDAMYGQLIEEGVGSNEEEIDAFFASIGYTMDTLIDEVFGALDFESIISDEDISDSYVYKIEDDTKLYMEESVDDYKEGDYAEFTISGNTLTLTEIYEDGAPTEEMREILPLVFEKVG